MSCEQFFRANHYFIDPVYNFACTSIVTWIMILLLHDIMLYILYTDQLLHHMSFKFYILISYCICHNYTLFILISYCIYHMPSIYWSVKVLVFASLVVLFSALVQYDVTSNIIAISGDWKQFCHVFELCSTTELQLHRQTSEISIDSQKRFPCLEPFEGTFVYTVIRAHAPNWKLWRGKED